MKKIILLLLLITAFVYGNLRAQTTNVPAEVTNAFKAKFPDVQNVEWKAENNDFHASFTLNGAQKITAFSSKGVWEETDTKMSLDSLPAIVKDGFKKSMYSDWTVH